MTPRPSRTARRAFQALLRLHPAWFRRAHGAEMQQLFEARHARVRGVRAAAVFWRKLTLDAVATAVSLRRARPSRPPGSPRPGGFNMWTQDLRYALRQLRRAPLFTAGAVALLAVGIGANVAVFTVVDAFLLRGLPYARPHEVVHIYQDSDDGEPSSAAFPAYRDIAAMTNVFESVAATSPARLDWDRDAGSVPVAVEFTTASYLAVAGLAVQRGQWFSPRHDVVGHEPVAVVSAPAWRSHFGGDPDIVGRTIRLQGQPVTIVGVGPDALSGSFDPVVTDFWLSISSVGVGGQFRIDNLNRREDHWYDVRARLAPGVSTDAARAALGTLAARLGETYPELDRGRDITLRPAADDELFPETRSMLSLASGIVLTLLLLACANLGNLLLVRGLARSGEVAVRRALGAGAARIGRLFLIESVCLSVAGGLAGLALAQAALTALPAAPLPPPFTQTLDLPIDLRTAAFAVGLMLATGLLFGLAPAVRLGPANLAADLRDDRRTSSLGRTARRFRSALITVQVAGSLVLILATGLLARSLVRMQQIDPGVDPDRVAVVRPNFSRSGLAPAEVAVVLEEMRARAAALPGVTHAAVATRLPAQQSGTTTTVVEGYEPEAGTGAVELNFLVATPEYFETVGLRLLEGRTFTAGDIVGTDRVVVVNQAAARRYWPGRSAVGGRIRSSARNAPFRTVVGVVEDAPVSTFPERDVRPMFYAAAAQSNVGGGYVFARTAGNAEALAATLRAGLAGTRASVPIQTHSTLAAHFGEALAAPRFLAGVMGAVSLLAVLLAALGIYAVVAFNVARRSGEMGIRMALGASANRLVRMIVGETVGMVGVGVAIGVGLAVVVAPRLESLLFEVPPLDVATFAGAIVLLIVVAWVAAFVPARRAAGADPARAFRAP